MAKKQTVRQMYEKHLEKNKKSGLSYSGFRARIRRGRDHKEAIEDKLRINRKKKQDPGFEITTQAIERIIQEVQEERQRRKTRIISIILLAIIGIYITFTGLYLMNAYNTSY